MWIIVAVLVGLAVAFVAAAVLFEIESAWLGAWATIGILVFSYGSVVLVRQVAPEQVAQIEPIVMVSAAIVFCIAFALLWRAFARHRRADGGERRQ